MSALIISDDKDLVTIETSVRGHPKLLLKMKKGVGLMSVRPVVSTVIHSRVGKTVFNHPTFI